MKNTTEAVLVNEKQVLALLGDISRTTLWRLRKNDGFPEPVHRRYHLESVMQWIDETHNPDQM